MGASVLARIIQAMRRLGFSQAFCNRYFGTGYFGSVLTNNVDYLIEALVRRYAESVFYHGNPKRSAMEEVMNEAADHTFSLIHHGFDPEDMIPNYDPQPDRPGRRYVKKSVLRKEEQKDAAHRRLVQRLRTDDETLREHLAAEKDKGKGKGKGKRKLPEDASPKGTPPPTCSYSLRKRPRRDGSDPGAGPSGICT